MTTTDEPGALFALVEIMGHRVRPGAISDAVIGGASMLRVEHPTAVDDSGQPVVEYYAPAALFSVKPCTRAVAEAACVWQWRTSEVVRALPSAADGLIDDDYDDDDDVEDEA